MPGAHIHIKRDEFRRVAFPAAFRAGEQAVFIGEAVPLALLKAVGAGEMLPAVSRASRAARFSSASRSMARMMQSSG